MNVKEFFKKNWQAIVFILIIAGLLLFNVKQYKKSAAIVRQNIEVNAKYKALLEREVTYNKEIANYKTQVEQKTAIIALEKAKIGVTESKLQISQDEAKRLSAKIKSLSTSPEGLQEYVEVCDSLATIAPILANQVDTLKQQNKDLVKTFEEISILKDSIISKKDVIIIESKQVLKSTVEGYNKSTDQLVTTENKLNKEKSRKTFWKKATVVLALAVSILVTTK